MSFDNISRNYLIEFQRVSGLALASGSKSIEMATRPVVHKYIEDIIRLCKKEDTDIAVHHDTTYTRSDRPDWRVEDSKNFGIYCFGDHKSTNFNSSLQLAKSEQTQIQRYLDFGRPVFVFDGIEFIFFNGDLNNPLRCELVNKPIGQEENWSKLSINFSVEMHVRKILENPGFRKWTENQLIQQLAGRARMAADEMSELISAPIGSGASTDEESLLVNLHKLHKAISENHDPSLRDSVACADFIAQVLVFGLFYAHTRNSKSLTDPVQRHAAIIAFWSSANISDKPELLRPFRVILKSLSDSLASKNVLSDSYNEIVAVLAHAEYMGTEPGPQDFHTLFEQFLISFDSKTRFDRGAFYTPTPLAYWMARFVNEISVKTFGAGVMALADKIIDPCCGTGGFLEAMYRVKDLNQLVVPSLIGFEILPAPYALAHYRLAEVFSGDDNPPDLKIVLTDTLADRLSVPINVLPHEFGDELSDAIVCSRPPFRLVIGNPPSSIRATSGAERTKIEMLMDEFRPPKLERSDRQNIQKALGNEAYRFLRWCADRVIESEKGILALVLPGAFCQAVSFQYARRWILENFQKIYILEIDADARRSDATQSIFKVLQGRLVLIAVKEPSDVKRGTVFYRDIKNNLRDEKFKYFSEKIELAGFASLLPTEPQWKFCPSASYPEDTWEKSWPLTATSKHMGIFFTKCSGVKLAPTAMLFHTQKPILLRRSHDLASNKAKDDNDGTKIIERWFSGQQKKPAPAKLSLSVKLALDNVAKDDAITKYLFRPFTNGWVINSDKVFNALSEGEGDGLRSRPELRAAFARGAIGIAIAPSPIDLGKTLTRFACFSWNLPDNDNSARGNAMIYCNIFPQKTKKMYGPVQNNISVELSSLFKSDLSSDKAAIYYIYAVLSSSTYLNTFEGVLYASANPDWPARVPISSNSQIRTILSSLGAKVAQCEHEDFIPSGNSVHSINHPGDFNKFELSTSNFDEINEEFSFVSSTKDVVIVRNVPVDVFSTRMCGHNVLEKWVRERKFCYLKRNFNNTDLTEFLVLVEKIKEQMDILISVDAVVATMFEEDKWEIPPSL